MIVFIFALLHSNIFPIEACLPSEEMMGTLINALQNATSNLNETLPVSPSGSSSGPLPGFSGSTSLPTPTMETSGWTSPSKSTSSPGRKECLKIVVNLSNNVLSDLGSGSTPFHKPETSYPDAGLLDCESVEWVGDGLCDDGNNHDKCAFDGGDCCGNKVDKYVCQECLCKDPSYETSETTEESIKTTFGPSTFGPSTFGPSTFGPKGKGGKGGWTLPPTLGPSTFGPSTFGPKGKDGKGGWTLPPTLGPSTFGPRR